MQFTEPEFSGKLEILDIYGRNIFFMEIEQSSWNHLLELDFEQPMATGVYLLKFTKPDGSVENLKILHE